MAKELAVKPGKLNDDEFKKEVERIRREINKCIPVMELKLGMDNHHQFPEVYIKINGGDTTKIRQFALKLFEDITKELPNLAVEED